MHACLENVNFFEHHWNEQGKLLSKYATPCAKWVGVLIAHRTVLSLCSIEATGDASQFSGVQCSSFHLGSALQVVFICSIYVVIIWYMCFLDSQTCMYDAIYMLHVLQVV